MSIDVVEYPDEEFNGQTVDDGDGEDYSEFEFAEDGRVPVALKRPVQFGEQRISELRFRDITGRDMRTLRAKPDSGTPFIMALAGKLCGQPTDVMDRLSGPDVRTVMKLVGGFMGGSLDAGAKSSEP